MDGINTYDVVLDNYLYDYADARKKLKICEDRYYEVLTRRRHDSLDSEFYRKNLDDLQILGKQRDCARASFNQICETLAAYVFLHYCGSLDPLDSREVEALDSKEE